MKKILVIDDEPIIRTSSKRTLVPEGYEVRLADSGRAGIDILENESFDLILLDLKMPDMGGIEVLKVIMERWPGTMVIIVTGYSSVDTAVEALRLGAFNHIEKPFTPDSLLAAVKEAFAKKD
jgi:DNA-binding NtrC family response regulator